MREKKNKDKVIYYDDNSTIVSMDALKNTKKQPTVKNTNQPKPQSTFGDRANTFWSAFKMMLAPTGVALLILLVLYLLLNLLVGNYK